MISIYDVILTRFVVNSIFLLQYGWYGDYSCEKYRVYRRTIYKSEIVRCQMKIISILDMRPVRTRIVHYQNANQIVHELVCRLYTYMQCWNMSCFMIFPTWQFLIKWDPSTHCINAVPGRWALFSHAVGKANKSKMLWVWLWIAWIQIQFIIFVVKTEHDP